MFIDRGCGVNQEQLTMRPKAELLIVMINALNRVDKHYLIPWETEYRSAINDFDLLINRVINKFTINGYRPLIECKQV